MKCDFERSVHTLHQKMSSSKQDSPDQIGIKVLRRVEISKVIIMPASSSVSVFFMRIFVLRIWNRWQENCRMPSPKRVTRPGMAPKISASMVRAGQESDVGRTRQYPPFLLPALSLSFLPILTVLLRSKRRGLRMQFTRHMLITQGRISGT